VLEVGKLELDNQQEVAPVHRHTDLRVKL
jgi:hypothetical protein